MLQYKNTDHIKLFKRITKAFGKIKGKYSSKKIPIEKKLWVTTVNIFKQVRQTFPMGFP
jgi:hypothetical protein